MIASVLHTIAALVFSCAVLSGCASDVAPEPEPEFEEPGSFVAVDDGEDGFKLFRMLSVLYIDDLETILFVTLYDVAPSGWDDAREISKRHDLPVRVATRFESKYSFTQKPYRVVWFRTLTREEEDRIP